MCLGRLDSGQTLGETEATLSCDRVPVARPWLAGVVSDHYIQSYWYGLPRLNCMPSRTAAFTLRTWTKRTIVDSHDFESYAWSPHEGRPYLFII